MQIRILYEKAVNLSPRAARIAAAMLSTEADIPQPLLRSLQITLAAVCVEADDKKRLLHLGNREAQAAQAFVASCKQACNRVIS